MEPTVSHWLSGVKEYTYQVDFDHKKSYDLANKVSATETL